MASRRALRVVGWLVVVGGSAASVAIFHIDHMTSSLWMDMGISVAASVAVGSLLLWRGR